MEWRLADAKNRFSELVNLALTEGPQRILRRGDAVLVVSQKNYDELAGTRVSFKDFLLGDGPSVEGLDIHRNRAPMRDVTL